MTCIFFALGSCHSKMSRSSRSTLEVTLRRLCDLRTRGVAMETVATWVFCCCFAGSNLVLLSWSQAAWWEPTRWTGWGVWQWWWPHSVCAGTHCTSEVTSGWNLIRAFYSILKFSFNKGKWKNFIGMTGQKHFWEKTSIPSSYNHFCHIKNQLTRQIRKPH